MLSLFLSSCGGSHAAPDGALDALTEEATQYLTARQETMQRDFKIGKYSHYDWSQDTGEIVFSDAGVPKVIARFQVVGDWSKTSKTWLWAWGNKSLDPKLAVGAAKARDYGKAHGLRKLTEAKWPAEQDDGWCMTAITAKLLGAKGAYRSPDLKSGGALFMVFTDIRWAPGAGPQGQDH
jgi:hypothetical protein